MVKLADNMKMSENKEKKRRKNRIVLDSAEDFPSKMTVSTNHAHIGIEGVRGST